MCRQMDRGESVSMGPEKPECIPVRKRDGTEAFRGLNASLSDYWAWAHSDIASNAERGKLAEYLVSRAVGARTDCRIEWDEVDAVSDEGIRIEVKSSAYLQTWNQKRFSEIRFEIAPKRVWDEVTGRYNGEKRRRADVYVFCLFTCREAAAADPLDLSQWEFYVLETEALNRLAPTKRTVGLRMLLRMGARAVSFARLHEAVRQAREKGGAAAGGGT